MGLFDDIFLPSRPRQQTPGLFEDIFGSFRQPEVGPPSPFITKLEELARSREEGDRQWAGYQRQSQGGYGDALMSGIASLPAVGAGVLEGLAENPISRGERPIDWPMQTPDMAGGEMFRQERQNAAANAAALMPQNPNLIQKALAAAPQTAAIVGATAINPILGAEAGLASQFGSAYGERRDRGVEPGQAFRSAGTESAIVGALEATGAGSILGKAWGAGGPAKAAQWIYRVAKGALGEGTTEGLQELVSIAAEAESGAFKDPGSLERAIKDRVPDSFLVGMILGGPGAAVASTARAGEESRIASQQRAADVAGMNSAFAEGISGPKPGLFTDIFHDPSLAAPAPAQAPISPPVAPSPVPAMQATQDARMQFLQVPESARIAAQMGETARAQDERAQMAADTLGARTPAELAQGMGIKANYMDFLQRTGKLPVDMSPTTAASESAVSPPAQVFTGKTALGNGGYVASAEVVPGEWKRTLMVDPSGGYFWGDWRQASRRDVGAVATGEHAAFTPAEFATSAEAREAASTTPKNVLAPQAATSSLTDLNAGIEVQPAAWKPSKKMSKEELRQAYLTSKTGIGNENAFKDRQAERPQAGPPSPPEFVGPPAPTLLQATENERAAWLAVPESAKLAGQMSNNDLIRQAQEAQAPQPYLNRTGEDVARSLDLRTSYREFLQAMGRMPADLSAPPVAAGPEFQPAPQTERVRRQEKLKPIDQMTPEELRAEAEIARMDTALGVGNRRAFFSEEDNPSSSQRVTWHIDLNGLGGVNDKISHTAGDAFLNKFVSAAKQAGLNLYRVGGDEFGGHERFGKHAEAKIAALKKSLEADPVILRDADGVEWEIPVTFGHGVSANYQRADADSIAAKQQQQALGLRGQKGELPPNTRRAGAEVSQGAVPRLQERSDPTLNPKPTDQVGIDYLTKNVTSALPSKEEVQPMEKWKPTNWTATKSGDEPFHWRKVNDVGDVFGASDGSWMLLGKPEKGKTYRTNSAEPANIADERVDETVDETGASVEAQFKKAQEHFDRARQRSSLFTKLEPRGFSGKGHQAEVWLNNGRAMKGRDFDFIQRNAPGARWFGEQGMGTAWLVDENGKVIGFFGTKVRGSAVSTTEQQQAQHDKREPGDDAPDPEDPYARAPVTPEDNSDLPEALRIVGPRALPDMDPKALKTWLRKWFTSKGNVSKDFRAVGEKREGAMAAGTIQHKEIAYALQHHQRAYLKAHPEVNPIAFQEAIRDVIHGTPKIGSVPLPAKIQNLAERARALVDSYSSAHVAQLQKMDPNSELAKVIEGNLGTYLNRAYQAFDDPHHLERVKESGLWDHYKERIAALPEMQGKSDEEVEGFMNYLADRKEDSFGSHGHGMGTLEMGIYKARKEIPLVIRQLMGEYTQPAVEFFQTAEKLNRNVATTEMYLALDELGTKEGWLTTGKAPVGELYKQIGGKAERSPIGGKFTNKEMHEIIVGAHENAQAGILGWLTGLIKTNKTVGSVQAQTRNFESQTLLLSAAGNLGARFTPWGMKTKAALGLKAATQQSRLRAGIHADRAGSLANMSNEELAGSWGRAAKLGIVGGGTPDLADIRHFFRESDKLVDPSNPIEKTWSALKSAYKAGDDIPRHAAWQSETAKILWHSPGMSIADAEAQAADLVRDTNPTDGRQMRALKALRKTPMVGGFISFVSEIPRNAKNIAAQGVRELKDGHAEGNKRKMIVGAHRLGSLAATLAAPELMATAIMALRHGDDDEAKDAENKAVLRFAPPWMKNSTLNVLHVKDGKAFVVDVSFMDPWATIKKPIMAAIRAGKAAGKDSGDVAAAVLRQIGEPYAQEGLGLTTMIDAMRNTDRYGGQITSPNAPLGKQISDYSAYIGKAVEPGTVTSARRIKKSITGEVEKSGRGYSLLGEVAALFGPRFMEIDARQGIKDAGRDYMRGQQEASRLLNDVTKREGRITPEEIADAQATADKAYEVGAYALIEAVEAARTLGLSKGEIIKYLADPKEGAGLSRDDVGAALVGIDELDRRRLAKAKTSAEHDRLLARKR